MPTNGSLVVRPHPLQPSWSRSTYDDRFGALREYVEGRNVLDIGVVSGHRRSDWVHGRIAAVAQRTVGIDIDETTVGVLVARGYDIRVMNAETLSMSEQFDTIVAGELIEHLSNAGQFLDRAREHLLPGGTLVLTTPNAFCLSNFVYRFGFSVKVHHEHTCWYCEQTLRGLLARHGFAVFDVKYLPHATPGVVRRLAARTMRALVPHKLRWRTVLVAATCAR